MCTFEDAKGREQIHKGENQNRGQMLPLVFKFSFAEMDALQQVQTNVCDNKIEEKSGK
jgi:hypothetical protein